jgi:hypothetical protein
MDGPEVIVEQGGLAGFITPGGGYGFAHAVDELREAEGIANDPRLG